jgi:hyperosmotically inducible protein
MEIPMRHRISQLETFFVAALFLAAGIVTGATGAQAANRAARAISSIDNQVQHQLAMLPWYGVFDNLKYQVNGGEVILTGQVISEHAQTKFEAENDVRHIPGVIGVLNQIEVLPVSGFDNQIRRAEYHTIFSQSDLGSYTLGVNPKVRIIVQNGHVSLEGEVMNQMDKDIAGIVANSVPGVFSVNNNLRIE